MAQARSARAINGKKQGSVFYSTEQENEVNKIFIISLTLEKRKHFKANVWEAASFD